MTKTSTKTDLYPLLQKFLGDTAQLTEGEPTPFHSNAVAFYSDCEGSSFQGFKGAQLFDVNLLFGELDHDHRHRLERVGDILVYTNFDRDNEGTYGVTGQAVACAVGSEAEAEFFRNAAQHVAMEAAGPLQSALAQFRATGLQSSLTVERNLLASLTAQP